MTTARGLRAVGSLVKGKWRIASVLRSGTAAALYLATNRSGGSVALKIVHQHLAGDDRVRERLLEEAEIGSLLDHSGVVRVLDEDTAEDGAALLLLEPLDGETLEARRRRLGGALALEDVFDISELLLDVVRAAHDKGLLHFELTPQNLFLTDTGFLKVLDFGALDGRPRTPLERGKSPMAWPAAFTAPELLLQEPSDVRSDIWSVGALLYTLVTGITPRPDDAAPASVASVPARALKESLLELPRAFVNIVDRALEFDRADRWPDVDALQQALRWARRSVEGGWGAIGTSAEGHRDSVVPRPSRSSLAEQARLARQRSSPPAKGSAPPPTGPTPVDVPMPGLARWREEALRKDERDRKSVDPAAVTPQRSDIEESTLVGVPAVAPVEEKPDTSIRLQPRRASEPTLQSASPINDSDRKPPIIEPVETTVSEAKSEHDADEPDTLIRAAPTPRPDGPSAPGTLGAADAIPDSAPATHERGSDAASADPPAPSAVEPQPPTVRIPSRAPPPQTLMPLRSVLAMAAAIGVVAGAMGFVLWPRPKPEERSAVSAADSGPLLTAASEAPPASPMLAPVETQVSDGGSTLDADADGSADAAIDFDEEDAAAILEAKLSAERKRRRALAALEAARAQEQGGEGGTAMATGSERDASSTSPGSATVVAAPATEVDAAPRAPKPLDPDGG